MKPIMEDVRKEYEGRAVVESINISEHPDAVQTYKIRLIPTEIFFDAKGKEVYRHEGYMAKEDIAAKLKEIGVAPPGK